MGTHEPDIRECLVWLEYTHGLKAQVEMELDIDSCIETQIRQMWEGRNRKLANFKWDLIERHQTIHNEEYS